MALNSLYIPQDKEDAEAPDTTSCVLYSLRPLLRVPPCTPRLKIPALYPVIALFPAHCSSFLPLRPPRLRAFARKNQNNSLCS